MTNRLRMNDQLLDRPLRPFWLRSYRVPLLFLHRFAECDPEVSRADLRTHSVYTGSV